MRIFFYWLFENKEILNGSQNARLAGVKVGNSCDQRCWAVMEDEKENLWLLQQNGFFRCPSWYFRRSKQQRDGNYKRAWVLNGVRNYVWRWFTSEVCEPCTERWRILKKFRSLSLASLSSQELSIVGLGSCVKRVCGSVQVGESPSFSQHYTVKQKPVNRESGRICLFLVGDQHRNKIPFKIPFSTTAVQRLPQF